jgi:HAD superfamily hydrolase (TIGR01484 family)
VTEAGGDAAVPAAGGAEPGAAGRPIRMIGTDLDGTLLLDDGSLSPGNLAALGRAASAGIPVVFATARPFRWMDDVARWTGHRGVAVCSNGAVLYHLGEQQVVSAELLGPGVQQEVAHALTRELGEWRFAVEHPHRFAHETGYLHDWYVGDFPIAVSGRAELLAAPGVKLLARRGADHSESHIGDDELSRARELVGDAAEVTTSGYGLLEISPAGVTKATGLAMLAEQLGIGVEEVAVVGDMPNDLPMLAWAGRSFAVANAHPSVLAAADQIVSANTEDGVAEVIDLVLSWS